MPEKRGIRRGPTGVATSGPGLTDDVKEQLRTIAAPKAPSTAGLDEFIRLVDMVASQYRASKALQDQALPATVREELKAAHEAFLRLAKGVNKLGGTSRHLLYTEGGPGNFERFHEALSYIAKQLWSARNRASELQTRWTTPQLR